MIPLLLITRSVGALTAVAGATAGVAAWLVPISVALITAAGGIGAVVVTQLFRMRRRPEDTATVIALAHRNARLETENARLKARLKRKGGPGA